MMNSQAANASPRCALATATSTIWSVGCELAVAVDHGAVHHLPARRRLVDDLRIAFSVIPG